MEIFHGISEIVKYPEIRVTKYNKDFYFGFYCTLYKAQAERWATRFGDGFINVFASALSLFGLFAYNSL